MFSIVFPGQGWQTVGMETDLYNQYTYIKELFQKADHEVGYSLSKIILQGPQEKLNQTEITQPAIFLVSFSIFQMLKRESNFDLNKIQYFAGHSLGEYSALVCNGSLKFEEAIRLLKIRGRAMQNAVPNGSGGMIAVLGVSSDQIEELLKENINKYNCFIANDNSTGQIVVSGMNKCVELFSEDLKKKSIKNIKLPVSAPFHCKLMNSATTIMHNEINKINFLSPEKPIISNVTAKETKQIDEIKDLLVKQIESPVRWRESVIYMKNNGITKVLEIGPGKVLSGLIKRIDRSISTVSINSIKDLDAIN